MRSENVSPIVGIRHPVKGGTLVVGCGYVGHRVATLAQSRYPDQPVYAATRSAAKAERFAAQGLIPVIADWTDRRSLRSLPACERTLVAVSHDRASGISRFDSQVGGMSNLLEHLTNQTDICYLSTTGVYHQTDGRWVDETSPARPAADGGKAHLQAESLLHRRRPRGTWTILRLAGIYGPGRIPRVADVLHRRPIDGPNAGFLNLIHLEDAALGICAAWDQTDKRRLYVVADDLPVIRRHFYEQIAKLAGIKKVEFATDSSTSPVASLSSRSASNKRVWNRRFRRDLMPRMQFPNYVAGLEAMNWSR